MEEGWDGSGGEKRREEKLKSFEWRWGMFKSVRVMWWGAEEKEEEERRAYSCRWDFWLTDRLTEGGMEKGMKEEEKEKEGQNYSLISV